MLIALCQGGRGNSGQKQEADSGLREPTGQEYGTGLFPAGYKVIQGIQGSKLGMYMRSLTNVNKESNSGISTSVAGLASAWPGGVLAQLSLVCSWI